MTYAQGGLITASDHNSLSWEDTQGIYTASPVNHMLGLGNSQFGYWQQATLANRLHNNKE